MSYTILEEFLIQRDDSVVHYSEIGSTVELSDDEAGGLVAAGKIAATVVEPEQSDGGDQGDEESNSDDTDETAESGENTETDTDAPAEPENKSRGRTHHTKASTES